MLTFGQFKDNMYARDILRRLDQVDGNKTWVQVLDVSASFMHLRENVIAHNGSLRAEANFVNAVRTVVEGEISDATFRLLCAFCCMLDFGHLADELAKKRDPKEGVWASLYSSMDRQYAELLATMVYEAAIA